MQGHRRPEGHDQLHEHQHHLGVSELVEQGHVVEEHVGQRSGISPRQHHGQQPHGQQRPAQPGRSSDEPCKAQGKGECSEVEGPSTESLLAPVKLVVAALDIRNGDAPPLSSRHAVFQNVVSVKAVLNRLVLISVAAQIRFAPGGVFRVLLGQGQLARLWQDGQQPCKCEHARGLGHLDSFPVQTRPDPRTHADGTQHEQEVIGHLDVVGRQVQGREPRRHTRTGPHAPTVGQDDPRQHTGHGGNGPHLGGVAGRQVQDVQTREAKSQAQQQRQPRRQPETQAQNVGREHRHHDRAHLNGDDLPNGHPRPPRCGPDVGARDLGGGHAAKHAVRPMRDLALALLHVAGLLGHANVVLGVALIQPLALQHHRREQHGRGEEHHHDRNQMWHRAGKQ